MGQVLISTLKQASTITFFVLFMMVVIEYVNIQSRSRWTDKLHHSPVLQIIISVLLGLTPGCMGAFTVVSLYTHGMVGLSGLVAVMIATSGDEAFVMFALFPGKALLLHLILFVVAITAGWLVHLFSKNRFIRENNGFVIHEQESCKCFSGPVILFQLKKISFERSVLLISVVLFTILLITGVTGSPEWGWEKITLLTGAFFLLFVFITVPDHFLKVHLYDHVLKKHLLRIFLWTWSAFILLHFIRTNEILTDLVLKNSYILLGIAVLIGMIPESGPHLVFVTLFSQGMIPFSILLANSIVQDGHGMLPLLAESRKDFMKVKLINMAAGLVVGAALIPFGI